MLKPSLLLLACLSLSACTDARESPPTRPALQTPATQPISHPYPGVTVRYIETANSTEPRNPQRVYAAIISLPTARPIIRVARGGPDPDGPGPAQTVLMDTTRIAAHEKFDLAINGDYFATVIPTTRPGEPPAKAPGFARNVPSTVLGPATTDGETWSVPKQPRPAFLVHKDGHLSIATVKQPSSDVTQAIAGNVLLVQDGKPLHQDHPDEHYNTGKAGSNGRKHPRTAVGISQDGQILILVVVDGRTPGLAEGMNHRELAALLHALGAHIALNLDGGGSSSFALRDPAADAPTLLNAPQGGKYQRPVANVLGLTFPK